MKRLFAVLSMGALALAGCTKSENTDTSDARAVASASSSTTSPQPGVTDTRPMDMPTLAAPSAPALAQPGEEPPNEQRAVRKAAREITKANYKSELTKVEKEIGAP